MNPLLKQDSMDRYSIILKKKPPRRKLTKEKEDLLPPPKIGQWFGMSVTPNGDVYAAVPAGNIYKQSGGTGDFVSLGATIRTHRW
jgi:hypothetical protein